MERAYIPEHLDHLTPPWLTQVLRERGVLRDAAVVDTKCEILGDGAGFLGVIARLSLELDRDEPGAPRTLIAKLPLAANRATGEMMGAYERENLFYEELADEVPVRTPRLYYGAFDRDRGSEKQAQILAFVDRLPVSWSQRTVGLARWIAERKQRRYVLLMEDLGGARSGDQLSGASVEDCARVLAAVARAHAAFWGGERLQGRFWLLSQDVDVRMRFGMFRDHRERFTTQRGDLLDEEVAQVLDWLDEHGLALMRRLFSGAPTTVVHCDLRLDNIFYVDDVTVSEDSVVVFDWQLVRRGAAAYDVAYFLCGALAPQTDAATEQALLRGYWEALCTAGVRDYQFERLLADYRRGLLTCVQLLSTTDDMEMGDDRGVHLMDVWIERLFGRLRGFDPATLL